jgi:hypothetical protein
MTSQFGIRDSPNQWGEIQGPETPETRAKLAQNSMKHGLTAVNTIILGCESEDEFNNLLTKFVAMHLPVGVAEQDAIEQMTRAGASTAEIALVDVEIARKPETDKEFRDADPGVHLRLALKALSDESRSFPLFSRYKSREGRIYDRSCRTLRELQAAGKAQEPKQPEAAPTPPPDGPKSQVHNPAPASEPEPTSKSDIQCATRFSPRALLSPMPPISLYTESQRHRLASIPKQRKVFRMCATSVVVYWLITVMRAATRISFSFPAACSAPRHRHSDCWLLTHNSHNPKRYQRRSPCCLLLFLCATLVRAAEAPEALQHARKSYEFAQRGDLARAAEGMRAAIRIAPENPLYFSSLGGAARSGRQASSRLPARTFCAWSRRNRRTPGREASWRACCWRETPYKDFLTPRPPIRCLDCLKCETGRM